MNNTDRTLWREARELWGNNLTKFDSFRACYLWVAMLNGDTGDEGVYTLNYDEISCLGATSDRYRLEEDSNGFVTSIAINTAGFATIADWIESNAKVTG